MYLKEKELLLQSNSEDVYSAWASIRLGIGNAAFKRLYSALGSAEKIYKLSDYSEFGITEKQAKRLSDKDLNEAEKCISSSIDKGFIPISYGSEYYPKKLKQLSNPPSIIYCKGNVPDFDKYFCVGIVGTRAPSQNALKETYNLSSELSKKGILIISGIALGIDSQAHSAALVENGFTVGVSGVKAGQIYPKK
ncbi:MAG: DNA-protecting protein DprA, partial [Clostridia bacterium]|nr:DNA-protecting protein DprA [Clostridia bacterium]